MTNDEIKSKQEETLNNIKKYNKDRNTEIVDDPEEILNELLEDLAKDDHFEEAMQEITEINEELGLYDEPVVAGWPTEEEIDAARKILAAFERAEKGITAPPMQEWLEAQDTLNKERGISVDEETEPEGYNYYVPPLLCQWCGALAYPGQIHGLGHCKEKIVYES